jgi:endonuclease/exonuclease/phosphatase family metal-dependent hydrolase
VIVAEWNIQVDDSSAAHARSIIDALTSFSPRPQVIVVAEAHGSQYNTYINELNNNTGLSWQGVFQPHCPPGAWNGSSCTKTEDEGVAVFSSLSNQGASVGHLPYADAWHSARAWVRLAVGVGGVTTHVFGTHLQVSNIGARNLSMTYLKSVTSNFSGPKLLAGDFNADPDQIDTTTGMRPNFIDSWGLLNSTRGLTCSTPNPTMKLDYWFMDQSGRITPNWSSVITWPGTRSDHFPVHASFTIR